MTRTEPNRWIALLLLLGVLALAYVAVLRPLFAAPLATVEARIGDLQVRNARLRGLLLQRPQIERRLAELNAQGGGGFLPQPSAELATAALVQQLEQVVGEASPGSRGCAIVNREPLEENPTRERYRRVTVQVRLRCGNAETVKVLHALESARPYLFVDALSITAQRYFAVPGSAEPQEGGLDVGFNLSGYILPSMGGAGGQ